MIRNTISVCTFLEPSCRTTTRERYCESHDEHCHDFLSSRAIAPRFGLLSPKSSNTDVDLNATTSCHSFISQKSKTVEKYCISLLICCLIWHYTSNNLLLWQRTDVFPYANILFSEASCNVPVEHDEIGESWRSKMGSAIHVRRSLSMRPVALWSQCFVVQVLYFVSWFQPSLSVGRGAHRLLTS